MTIASLLRAAVVARAPSPPFTSRRTNVSPVVPTPILACPTRPSTRSVDPSSNVACFGSPEGASIDVVDTKGMADLGEAIRTDTMDDYGDVFVTP